PLRLMAAAVVRTVADAGDRICTVGATRSAGGLRVTTRVFAAVARVPSVTVIVIVFAPMARGREGIVQLAAPEAAPDPPRSLIHVTRSVPVPPNAVPATAMDAAVVTTFGAGGGAVIVRLGAAGGAGGGTVPPPLAGGPYKAWIPAMSSGDSVADCL